MKKLIAISVLAAMLCVFAACDGRGGEVKDTSSPVSTSAQTKEPAAKPAVISIDQVKSVIESAKEEYASAAEVTLSDGKVISAETKNPGITAESVASGEATAEQIKAYAVYMANIRQVVCDRLISFFPNENKLDFTENPDIGSVLLFLDPVSDGFDSAGDALMKMAENKAQVTDYISVKGGSAVFFDAETEKSEMICPNAEENGILTAIASAMSASPEAGE